MVASQRKNNTSATDRMEASYVVYKIGIYGWRKRCLYFLILLILIMAILNLALTIWIIRVQDFGLHGMGKLHITNNGLRMDGTAEFLETLRTKSIASRTDSPIRVNSRKNISLSAVDENNNVMGQITLDSQQIIFKNKELLIQDQSGRTLLYADDKKMKLDIENLDITVPGGLSFQSSVQTSHLKGDDYRDLKVESLTKKLYVNAADGVEMNSYGHDVQFNSLMETTFNAQKGKIVLNSPKIQLQNLRKSSVPDTPITSSRIYENIAEVCMCRDGTLFLAPPDSNLPCKVTSGVCL